MGLQSYTGTVHAYFRFDRPLVDASSGVIWRICFKFKLGSFSCLKSSLNLLEQTSFFHVTLHLLWDAYFKSARIAFAQ